MFDVLLPESDDQPVYQRLYEYIRDRIRSGSLADGTRLPSVRALQVQLNVSKTPIETAYQMLLAEGYAVSRPRSGVYVSNPYPAAMNDRPRLDSSPPGPAAPAASTAQPQAARPTIIDFDPSRIDTDTFPIRTWLKMLKESLEAQADEIGSYGHPMGEWGLRAELAVAT